MTKLFLHVALVVLAQVGDKDAPRKPNPLAPSLPLLNKEEAARYEAVIDRFIQYDTGKLKGAEGKKALEEFHRLPAEAIFELIDGFNRAANMEHSCPSVIIGKKILKILNASDDLELLTFAKENVGADVTAKRHLGMIREVQFGILLRKGAVQRKALAGGGKLNPGRQGEKSLSSLPLPELVKKADQEKGLELKSILTEIEKRQGPKVFETLAIAAKNEDNDIQKLSLALLAKHMTRQSSPQLKDLLKNDQAQVRAAAAKEVGARKVRHVSELIDLLNDAETDVQQAARQALVQIGGVDHGPAADASFGDRQAAQRRWRAWWEKQVKR
jgi:hypothetical protein